MHSKINTQNTHIISVINTENIGSNALELINTAPKKVGSQIILDIKLFTNFFCSLGRIIS